MVDYVKYCREEAENTFYGPSRESWTMVGDYIEGLQRLQEETRKALTSQIETNAQLADHAVKLEAALRESVAVADNWGNSCIADICRKALEGGPGETPAS